MNFCRLVYRIALLAYPSRFRRCYAGEMIRVFEERLRDAQQRGGCTVVRYAVTIAGDLLASAMRERMLALRLRSALTGCAAVLGGGYAAYVDFHATEVQATLLVLLLSSFLLGGVHPRGAWRWALIVAGLLPGIHLLVFAVEHAGETPAGHPYFSRLMILLPALLAALAGAYAGVALRGVAGRLNPRFGPPTPPAS
jgi:hypothetical protein